MSWKCFIVKPISKAEVSLRRWTTKPCKLSRMGYHNASVVIGEENYHGVWYGAGDDTHPHDDPKWPLTCDCDYIFSPEDHWQYNLDRIFEGMRGNELVHRAHRKLPPGAMWSIEPGSPLAAGMDPTRVGPDGLHWILRLPNACEFDLYGQLTSDSRQPWQVTGVVPEISISPSIDFNSGLPGGYHGWVGSSSVPLGYVGEDVNGRRFDAEGVILL